MNTKSHSKPSGTKHGKATVLMDVDGVVADLIGKTKEQLPHCFENHDPDTWYLEDVLSEEEFKQCLELWKTKGFCLSLPTTTGAQNAVLQIHNKGYDIRWVTAPLPDAYHWMPERVEWLRNHFHGLAPLEHIMFATDKARVQGTVLIDDKPSNVELWAKSNPHGLAILFDAPWNRTHQLTRHNTKRALTWEHVLNLLDDPTGIFSKERYAIWT